MEDTEDAYRPVILTFPSCIQAVHLFTPHKKKLCNLSAYASFIWICIK